MYNRFPDDVNADYNIHLKLLDEVHLDEVQSLWTRWKELQLTPHRSEAASEERDELSLQLEELGYRPVWNRETKQHELKETTA